MRRSVAAIFPSLESFEPGAQVEPAPAAIVCVADELILIRFHEANIKFNSFANSSLCVTISVTCCLIKFSSSVFQSSGIKCCAFCQNSLLKQSSSAVSWLKSFCPPEVGYKNNAVYTFPFPAGQISTVFDFGQMRKRL